MPVVVGVGHASISGVPGLGKLIDAARSKAILQANADGWSTADHPEQITKYMENARMKTKREFHILLAEKLTRQQAEVEEITDLAEIDGRIAKAREHAATLYPEPEPVPGPKPAPEA